MNLTGMRELEARNAEANLRALRQAKKIDYCSDCGEYLGDFVNGILYKFGKVVTEPHICQKKS